MSRSRGVVVALVAVIALAGTACSSASSGASPATPTTVAASRAPYAKTGPYEVGFTRLHLAGGRNVVVWYPAQADAATGHQQETIDIAGMLTPELQAKVPPVDRVLYRDNAYENAPAAASPGNYPLVVFSHGFAGYPEQSVTLTTHLASWGFVVAAPDHVERSLDGLLGTATNGVPTMTDLAVLQSTVDLVERKSLANGALHGLVDANRVVAAGHSAGAGAAYQFAAADPRVKAWISYSVGSGIGFGGAATSVPKKPGMVMLGTTDGIIAPAKSVQVYNGMQSPKYLVKISRAGHLVFSDICLIARDKGGITGIAKAIKLPIPASLLKLGSDGCETGHPKAETAFPAIDQLSVAFFRSALGIDPQPVGLDSAAVANLGADVSVASQP
jgi:predicted dienelactone hydrolase